MGVPARQGGGRGCNRVERGQVGLCDDKWLLYMNDLTLVCPTKVVFQDHKCMDCLWLETGTTN